MRTKSVIIITIFLLMAAFAQAGNLAESLRSQRQQQVHAANLNAHADLYHGGLFRGQACADHRQCQSGFCATAADDDGAGTCT